MKFALRICAIFILLHVICIVYCNANIFPEKFQTYNQRPLDEEEIYANLRNPFDNPELRGSLPIAEERTYNEPLSEQMRAIKQFLDSKRPTFEREYIQPFYIGPNGFNQYQVKHPNEQILDDIRPYPNDDTASVFYRQQDDESQSVGEDFMGKFQGGRHIIMNDIQEVPVDERNADSVVQNFKDLPFVKDASEFAYAPTDERFFENPGSFSSHNGDIVNKVDKEPTFNERQEEIDDKKQPFPNDIYINQRNGGLMLGGPNFDQLGNDVDIIAVKPHGDQDADSTRIYALAIIAGVSAAAIVTSITLVITWFNLQKYVKNAADVEYPAYGVTGPNKDISPSGDRRLAQSAQMYHYQHQKQQIIAMERAAANERRGSVSDAESDEENEEGDYTVYECPGLAPTGEMEVKNPLFQDDPTPSAAQTPQAKEMAETQETGK